jgi:hypothetical protein
MSTRPDEYDAICPAESGYVPPAEPHVPDYDDRPSTKQLSYLRTLADRIGRTFAYPAPGRIGKSTAALIGA